MLLIRIYKGVIYKTLVCLSINDLNKVGAHTYYCEFKKVWGTKSEFGWVSTVVTINQRKYWVLIFDGGGTTLIFQKNRVSHLWSCILYHWSPLRILVKVTFSQNVGAFLRA